MLMEPDCLKNRVNTYFFKKIFLFKFRTQIIILRFMADLILYNLRICKM